MTPFDADLQRLNQALSEFIAFLEEEAIALAAQDSARLEALLPRRGECHRKLAHGWMKLSDHAGTQKPSGLLGMRARLFANGPTSDDWQRLEELVHTSDRLNRVNGRLIEEQMRRTQAAMQVLQNSISSRGVYGADGRVTDLFNVNRRIDSA
jgi:flagellar biosynthesis/type III secretory pathway chaperone